MNELLKEKHIINDKNKKEDKYLFISHTFEPVYDIDSKILILGTLPSVKSRENNFYYGNTQNRFWKIISSLTGNKEPNTIEEKKKMLILNKIALWDVIKSCEIIGSDDSSIRNVTPVDIMKILKYSKIEKIYANGNKSRDLYNKYLKSKTGIDVITLPSTSPANARYSLNRLMEKWSLILTDLE